MASKKIIFIFIAILLVVLFWLFSYKFIPTVVGFSRQSQNVEKLSVPNVSDLLLSRYINIPNDAKVMSNLHAKDGLLSKGGQISASWIVEFDDGSKSNILVVMYPTTGSGESFFTLTYNFPDTDTFRKDDLVIHKLNIKNDEKRLLKILIKDQEALEVIEGNKKSSSISFVPKYSVTWKFTPSSYTSRELGIPDEISTTAPPQSFVKKYILSPIFIFSCMSPFARCFS